MLFEIDGVEAHEEDRWVGTEVRVGAARVVFKGDVGRCAVTSRDPDTGTVIPCRVLFVFSTADAKVCRVTREQAVVKLRAGLEQLARSVREGRRYTDAAGVTRRVAKRFGQRGAARYFRWELQPLTAEEQVALPAFRLRRPASAAAAFRR